MDYYTKSYNPFNILTPILVFIFFVLYYIKSNLIQRLKSIKSPPSPLSLPLIGHLHLLAKYPENPWLGFDKLRERFGDVVALKLGQRKTVLISSPEVMREVLLMKGDIFCDRPSIYRYSLIFGRNKNNSLALCDWSDLQKVRRNMAQTGIIPKYGSKCYKHLSKSIETEVQLMIKDMKQNNQCFELSKQNILILCANIFMTHLCTKKPPNDCKKYLKAIENYDFVFYDINQCYPMDFIPFLSRLGSSKRYLNFVEDSANSLRNFVEKEVVNERLEETINKLKNIDNYESEDFLDALLEHYVRNPSSMSWSVCLYEIGDLIGGHSAVGNLLMRLIGFVALNESVQNDLHREAINALNKLPNSEGMITLNHRSLMPLTESSILETLRIGSSPIVPHVNRHNTTLQNYTIEKGTMVLFNTYHLNSSPDYWSDPQKFNPSRFVTYRGNTGHILKPDHFFPFSSGRRMCLGHKMVQTIAFTAISNLILNFEICPINAEQRYEMSRQLAPKGCLALDLSEKCFKVAFNPRSKVL